MLSFKKFLIEESNRIEHVRQHNKDLTVHERDRFGHDVLSRHFGNSGDSYSSNHIIDYLAHHDPSPKKVHTQWMIHQYKKGNFRLEDAPRIKADLTHFMNPAIKNKLSKKDINQHTPNSLADSVAPHTSEKSMNQKEKEIKQEGAELIHHDASTGVTVHHLKTAAAGQRYCSGTKWCTSNEETFNFYSKDGPIHVIQHQGRKYQFHNNSEQLMDEKDNPVHFHDMHPDISRSFAASSHPQIREANIRFSNPHYAVTEHDVKAAKDSGLKSTIVSNYPEMAHHFINDKHATVRAQVVAQLHLAKQLLNDPSTTVRAAIAYHHNSLAGSLINDKSAPVREQVTKHPNHAEKMIKDKSAYVRAAVAAHKHLTHHFVNDKSEAVLTRVASDTRFSHLFENHKNVFVRNAAKNALRRAREASEKR